MDSFLFFWEMYAKASFWRILVDSYRPEGRLNLGLFIYSILSLVILAALSFRDRDLYSNIGFLFVAVWGYWLWRGMRRAYSHYYREYSERLSFYRYERQYLRYLIFRDEILKDNRRNGVSIADAIAHIDTDLDTEVTDPFKVSIFVTLIISVFSALLGSLTAKWGSPYIVLFLYLLVILVLIGGVIIGSVRSKRIRLIEIKRYLIWLQRENALTSASR